MDAILGLPWLRGVQPAIDWQTQRVLWEHEGDVVWVYGRGAPPSKGLSASCATRPKVEVVSTKRFCRDLQRGGVVDAAWVGLLRAAPGTCASA